MSQKNYPCGCHKERQNRFIEPSLLLLLCQKPAHGYELLAGLEALGFYNGPPDPGAVYRTLRHMEKFNLVRSQWDTSGTGPAKRLYQITEVGKQYLNNWVEVLRQRYAALGNFLRQYQQVTDTSD